VLFCSDIVFKAILSISTFVAFEVEPPRPLTYR